MGSVVVALIALVAMKSLPEWIEYGKIVKAVKSTATDAGLKDATVSQVRAAYQKRSEIDEIKSVTAQDIEITKEGNELVIAFAYTSKVHLFSNVSLVFDFEGSSAKQ
jgi:hypothetical protein